ncbi:MAG TPA: tetratricopeptide repeat protein [Candidatus Binatia bacterium]
MQYLGHVVLALIAATFSQEATGFDASKIDIANTGKFIPYRIMEIDAGPVVGNMLNAHYFPGIDFYSGGRYKEAEPQFTYVIERSRYLEANPRQAEFMSTAHYLRGMIYFYHATGIGRLSIAKQDFEAALQWNPRNYIVLLELSRLYSGLGYHEQASSILRHLLDLKPDEEIARQAQIDLDTITLKRSNRD